MIGSAKNLGQATCGMLATIVNAASAPTLDWDMAVRSILPFHPDKVVGPVKDIGCEGDMVESVGSQARHGLDIDMHRPSFFRPRCVLWACLNGSLMQAWTNLCGLVSLRQSLGGC